MAQCDECNAGLVEDMKFNNWLALYSMLEFLHSESTISDMTFDKAINRLMTFKRYATAAEAVIFDEPPTEEEIESAMKRLRKEWVDEDGRDENHT